MHNESNLEFRGGGYALLSGLPRPDGRVIRLSADLFSPGDQTDADE